MKNLLMALSSVLLLTSYLACQTEQQTDTNDSLVHTIATDEDYITWRKLVQQRAHYVRSNTIDFEQVDELIAQHPDGICDLSDDIFKEIRGGEAFKSVNCEMIEKLRVLNKKYEFSQLSDEMAASIRAYNDETYGTEFYDSLKMETFSNLQKELQ